MKTGFLTAGLFVSSAVSASACGGVLFFDVSGGDAAAWATAMSGYLVSGTTDFSLDAAVYSGGFTGPLTSAGGGSVSSGIVAMNHEFFSVDGPAGVNLLATGPTNPFYGLPNGIGSAGFGNTTGALALGGAAAVFAKISGVDESFRNDASIIIKAFNQNNEIIFNQTINLPVYGGGQFDVVYMGDIGLIATNGDIITRLDIQKTGDAFSHYHVFETYNVIPAPGAAALFCLAGLVGSRRRRD